MNLAKIMKQCEPWQKDFFQALTLPLRGSSRKATELHPSDEGHSVEFFSIAEKWIKPNQVLSAAERLELYHRQYWYRILDSLAEDFPVLRKMSGDQVFWDLIEQYLLTRPSQSFTLRHLGEGFAVFLSKSEILNNQQRRWFEAIARIEYAYMESFEALQSALPQAADLENKMIGIQRHVRLLHLPVPADLCVDWEDFAPAYHCPHESVSVAIWRRPSGSSGIVRIPNEEACFLSTLAGGVFLTEFFTQLPEPHPEAAQVSSWFADWQARGWLCIKGEQGLNAFDIDEPWQEKQAMSSQAMSFPQP